MTTSNKRHTIEFVRDFLKTNRRISLVDNIYVNNVTPIKCKCDVCGYIWDGIFANIKHKQGCPECGRISGRSKHRRNLEDVLVDFVSRNIIPLNLEVYKNSKTTLLCQCKICEHEWQTSYNNSIFLDRGCPMCRCKKISLVRYLSTDDVEKKLNSHNIKLIRAYLNSNTPLECQCKKCNKKWISYGLPSLSNLNEFCQHCNNIRHISEKICRLVMEDIFDVKFPKKLLEIRGIGGGRLELDGYNDILKIAFEHNGPQHYKPKCFGKDTSDIVGKFNIQIKNDNIKKQWCIDNNIILITFRDLGKYTKEQNIVRKIKLELGKYNRNFPAKIDNYIPDFQVLKTRIISNPIAK